MNNDITITLTGNAALDYLRNQSLDESTIAVLQELVETKDKEIKELSSINKGLEEDYNNLVKQHDILDKKYIELSVQQNSYRLARDTDLAKDVLQHTVPTTGLDDLTVLHHHEEVEYREPPKLKTRLSKQDTIDLDTLAKKNFTSDHRVDKFAKARNLRPSTVKTYIKKHSEGKYTIVKGSDIKTGDMGYKFSVAKNALYFTLNDGRYDS